MAITLVSIAAFFYFDIFLFYLATNKFIDDFIHLSKSSIKIISNVVLSFKHLFGVEFPY
jgi:hypothetical protein